ncbi:NHL repeat-containing protein [Mucilaginibacter xinganensis]|uniref:NHL repeat-containing protein n=1 Tax=Mucilaginibacter xinganensis TaxID=1234841 RepID=A0A223NRG0_9SPHI|nr:NHL repeat-containing protein [Mucilaginibacter xinganensis]ASU32340.1 NHL repeat-containing protein [Mucilaginibacter xinganensis]
MKTPYFRKVFLPALFLSVLVLAVSCKKTSTTTTTDTGTAPTVTTAGLIINLTSTTAQSGGTISDVGNSSITANGVCYSSTNKTPTITDSKTSETVSTSGTIPINFTSNITGLTAGTTYYLRAYASNSGGTAYGSVVQFTTSTGLGAVVTAVTTLAGNGTVGYADGTGLSAMFNNPSGIAADASGKIYVADTYNNRIRAVTAAGLTTTLAGTGVIGYADGSALAAEFYGPNGMAVDAQGNVYVADFGNNVIRKITAAGVASTLAGNGTAGFVNGTGTAATFNNPAGIAVDASGNVYVADHGNNAIRKITAAGVVTTLAGVKTAGYVNATGTAAAFDHPNGVAADAAGNVYVADQGNSAIRKITSAGVVTTIAGGPTQTDLINYPAGIALDAAGNIYIADEGGRIMECTTANVLYILAGTLNVSGFVNGTGTSALFNSPQAITVDANNNIYVADQNNNCIRKLTVTRTP